MVLAVVHPRGARARLWRDVQRELEARGVELDARPSERPGHAREIAARGAAGAAAVVAVGGDGTVFEVVNGLMDAFPPDSGRRPPPLAIVPVGTGNDFVRALGGPRDAASLASALAQPRPQPVDLGRLALQGRNVYFTASATMGFSGDVTRRAAAMPRAIPGTAVYLLSLFLSLLTWRSGKGRLTVDGQSSQVWPFFNLNVANTRYYGGGMINSPHAEPGDGLLDLVLMELTKPQVLRAMPENYRGRFERVRGVRLARFRSLQVDADRPLVVQADGEIVGTTPVEIQVMPGALDLLLP